MPSFIVESIEFDFEDSQGVLPPDQQKRSKLIMLWEFGTFKMKTNYWKKFLMKLVG